MPYLPTAQSFLEQSTLLISARPTTTRITTTYNIPHPSPPPTKYKPSSQKPTRSDKENATASETDSKAQARARRLQPTLTLKTYDTASGTCLKYKTTKGAEVGRLVASLGRCGRVMAALPLEEEKLGGEGEAMEGVEQQEEVVVQSEGAKAPQEKGRGGGAEGGGKKKKKGKR